VDNYSPDIIWFDSWLDKIPEGYRQKMVAHFFNTAVSRGQKPIVAHKQQDLPDNVSILDIEQGGKTDISEDYWLTDITLSHHSWCYINGQTYKTPSLVIRNMVDVWSKKGVVLLNISPKADGSIPEEQRSVLAALGKWIDKHKEAVFETRAYSVYGYGEAAFKKGEFGGQSATTDYNEKDIRFTLSKDKKNLYVFSLGLPASDSKLEIRTPMESGVKRVSVLGTGKELEWTVTDNLLTLTTPATSDMDEMTTVFKVELE
jgi:alpha-L-fucosidase